jgi:hypothetical protein
MGWPSPFEGEGYSWRFFTVVGFDVEGVAPYGFAARDAG